MAEQAEEKRNPALDEAWEKLWKEVARYDDDMVKNWKEDIDTLLVFAGLFSAVVTAFVIESYQWLTEDPGDATVMLLTQISMQLNASHTIPERTPFEADPSSIRINCVWFLSLIFSLTSGLFALLCKQWLREHQRDTTTTTPAEALALRQLRRESLDKWGVPSFLSALPILLELGLLCFFAGILDLLWSRHHIPFALCFVAVMLSSGLYFITTLLPTLIIPKDQLVGRILNTKKTMTYQFICPYKSPQAWVIYRLYCMLLNGLRMIPLARRFVNHYITIQGLWDQVWRSPLDWPSFDLKVIRRFDQHVYPFSESQPFNLKVYELRALQWAVKLFRDSPSMIPHLERILGTLQPSVAMSAVLNHWDFTMWEDITPSDVSLRLRQPRAFWALKRKGDGGHIWTVSLPKIRDPILHTSEGIKLLFCHQYWLKLARGHRVNVDHLYQSIEKVQLQIPGLHFVVPFGVVDVLWTHENPWVRRRSLRLLRFFTQPWNSKSSTVDQEERHDLERLAFVVALTRHINRTDCTSELLTSRRGHEFIRFVNNQVVVRRLYKRRGSRDYAESQTALMSQWSQATRKAREVGKLPGDYFTLIPDRRVDPPPSNVTYPDIRYSVDTIQETNQFPSLVRAAIRMLRSPTHPRHARIADSDSAQLDVTPEGYSDPRIDPINVGEDDINVVDGNPGLGDVDESDTVELGLPREPGQQGVGIPADEHV
ncbi:hypothetical protein Moror_16113 [Moniliophthora roreri MCA 2997]|uniref:DUF6535 domain-containing protein n=2 Tax=Moniliophthora roreri TaxID=221103 RepID=V2WRJ0_MONRO|nr:hypothetical protein Moror_16113 [Moniliophthora roreri MCA 2997]KAI3611580.1 hypothetical protein WG66_007831 [Moniliophthora roreri]